MAVKELLVNAGIGIKKVFMLGSEGLSPEQKEFIALNSVNWQELDVKNNGSYVLMDGLLDNPIFYLASALVGKHIAYNKKMGTLFLLPISHDTRAIKICDSYRPDGFIFLNTKNFDPKLRIKSFIDTRRLSRGIKTGENLLSLEYGGRSQSDTRVF